MGVLLVVLQLLAVTGAVIPAASIDPEIDRVVVEMTRDHTELRLGKSRDSGQFVVALIPLESLEATAIARSRQLAMQRIGEYLGAQVSSDVKSGSSEGVKPSGEAVYSSFFSSRSRVLVEQRLAGIEGIRPVESDGLHMSYLLREKGALRLQAPSSEPAEVQGAIEVEALGVATIGSDRTSAQSTAREAAKRAAVEMAMGATLVGMTFSLTEEGDRGLRSEFREASFSSTDGYIEAFDVLDEGEGAGGSYFVRIRAKIERKKLLSDYRAYLLAIGDPTFAIDARDSDGARDAQLETLSTMFFKEKGLRLVNGARGADWSIEVRSTYTPREHPTSRAPGVQCLVSFALRSTRTGEIESAAASDGKASNFLSGGESSQRRRAVTEAFKESGLVFHTALNSSILRMAREGRSVRIRVAGFDPDDRGVDVRVPTELAERLREVPGLETCVVKVESGWLVIDAKARIPSDMLARLISAEACKMLGNSSERVTKMDPSEIEIYLDRADGG